MLVPWIWSAIFIECIAAFILLVPRLAASMPYLNIACVLSIVGIWIEKGPGMVVSGFVPTPLGEIVEYFPTAPEVFVCIGIWAFGLLVYSWLLHLAVPILSGRLRHRSD